MTFSFCKKLLIKGFQLAILGVFATACIKKSDFPTSDFHTLEETFQPDYIENQAFLRAFDEPTFEKAEVVNENLFQSEVDTSSNSKLSIVPRTILALWDSKFESDIEFTTAHKCVEMPLNFFGVRVEYVDLQKPLPQIRDREDVIGILSWLPDLYKLRLPNVLIRWLIEALDSDKKLLLVGTYYSMDPEENLELMGELWGRLGLLTTDYWVSLTYEYEVAYQNPFLFPFEGRVKHPLPDFFKLKIVDPSASAHFSLRNRNQNDEIYPTVVTGPKGGFAFESYLLYRAFYTEEIYKRWLINPFRFLKLVYDLPDAPIPDPTTVAGRRAYYSHIDGDGWNNETEVIDTRGKEAVLSSEIILKQVVEASPDLPVTVGPIAANLNPEWNALPIGQELAKLYFDLPQVEMGCHTYTHPFDWRFFEDYNAQKETPFLQRYETKTWEVNTFGDLRRLFNKHETFYKLEDPEVIEKNDEEQGLQPVGEHLEQRYYTPRAYALKPFDLRFEVVGAIDEVNKFSPSQDKQVEVYQWSGNTLPWKEAIAMTASSGVRNINGGDPRFDFLHPSYSYVSALARVLGAQIQVFTSGSNENLYTELWTKNFYGFATLPTTWQRCETPIRIKPINLYYHMYSGEKLPSLHALLLNLSYVRSQKICPIPASLYCKWVDGFYSTLILAQGKREWRIQKRGALNDFRIDQATFLGVDMEAAEGIIGQKHFQGSLYIYLDAAHDAPFIVLKDIDESHREPDSSKPYLIDSRWQVSNLSDQSSGNFAFSTQGFGIGEMHWKVPEDGIYDARLYDAVTAKLKQTIRVTSTDKELTWIFSESAIDPCRVKIRYRGLQDPEVALEDFSATSQKTLDFPLSDQTFDMEHPVLELIVSKILEISPWLPSVQKKEAATKVHFQMPYLGGNF